MTPALNWAGSILTVVFVIEEDGEQIGKIYIVEYPSNVRKTYRGDYLKPYVYKQMKPVQKLIREVEKKMLKHNDEFYLLKGDIVIKADDWKKMIYKYSILKTKEDETQKG